MKPHLKVLFGVLLAASILFCGCIETEMSEDQNEDWRERVNKAWEDYKDVETVDDWQYDPETSQGHPGPQQSSSSSGGNTTIAPTVC